MIFKEEMLKSSFFVKEMDIVGENEVKLISYNKRNAQVPISSFILAETDPLLKKLVNRPGLEQWTIARSKDYGGLFYFHKERPGVDEELLMEVISGKSLVQEEVKI